MMGLVSSDEAHKHFSHPSPPRRLPGLVWPGVCGAPISVDMQINITYAYDSESFIIRYTHTHRSLTLTCNQI